MPLIVSRKTTDQILQSKDGNEIHDWLEAASEPELREYLRKCVRDSSLAQHARDALDILLAKRQEQALKSIETDSQYIKWFTIALVGLTIVLIYYACRLDIVIHSLSNQPALSQPASSTPESR